MTSTTPTESTVADPTEPRPPKVRQRSSATSLFDPAIVRRAVGDSFVKLDPRQMARNPVMFVVEICSVLTTILFFQKLPSAKASDSVFVGLVSAWLWFTVLFANFAEAVAEGRGKAQADTLRKTRADTIAAVRLPDGTTTTKPSGELASRRRVRRARRRADPRRRRDHRRHRLRRRVGHHRRVGTGHPRVGRRPFRRDGWHACAVRPDHRAHHVEAGRDVPRPHDRARRRRRAAEDAERDRAQHPAGRTHAHLPARGRDAPAVRDLLARGPVAHRAGRVARVPDPHDDRRVVVGDRHRGNGPARAAQRARHERPRGRSRGRLLHVAARQDGHHHLRQPPSGRVHLAPGCGRTGSGRVGVDLELGRRDPRRPLDRHVRRGALRPEAPATSRTPSSCRSPRRPA